jgi:hypothetical protein
MFLREKVMLLLLAGHATKPCLVIYIYNPPYLPSSAILPPDQRITWKDFVIWSQSFRNKHTPCLLWVEVLEETEIGSCPSNKLSRTLEEGVIWPPLPGLPDEWGGTVPRFRGEDSSRLLLVVLSIVSEMFNSWSTATFLSWSTYIAFVERSYDLLVGHAS